MSMGQPDTSFLSPPPTHNQSHEELQFLTADLGDTSSHAPIGHPNASMGGEAAPGPLGFIKQSRHPTASAFHLLFKTLALVFYLFSGTFANFIFVNVLCILLLAFDFWTVKNVTGRLLVGLRWWNYVREVSKRPAFRVRASRPIDLGRRGLALPASVDVAGAWRVRGKNNELTTAAPPTAGWQQRVGFRVTRQQQYGRDQSNRQSDLLGWALLAGSCHPSCVRSISRRFSFEPCDCRVSKSPGHGDQHRFFPSLPSRWSFGASSLCSERSSSRFNSLSSWSSLSA